MTGKNRQINPHPWDTLADVPEEIRATMTEAFDDWEKTDRSVKTLLDLIAPDKGFNQSQVQKRQSNANRFRIPELVRLVRVKHGLSLRSAFLAVGFFVGIHEKNVQKIYYRIPWRAAK